MQAAKKVRSRRPANPRPKHQTSARKHLDLPRPEIIVRRPKLRLDAKHSRRWLDGRARTLLLHALSPVFPAGERFFIKTVMAFKEQIKDPQLREEMRRFAAQEAVHTKEHIGYDDVVQKHYDLKRIEELAERDLSAAYKWLSNQKSAWFNGPRVALAVTVALEHVTATLGRQILRDPDILHGADPEFARLWCWHAAEEIEHKAVAFDVFEAVGGTYLERCLAYFFIANLFGFETWRIVRGFLQRDGEALRLDAWLDMLGFLFVSPGGLRHAVPDFLDYFRPGFHPWDYDDRPLLRAWKAKSEVAPG